ncbi:uncharacterized mitochondrial protein-like protein [Tanacetum coccineum]
MFLLADLFLLVVTCFCCAQFDIADWLVSATSHLVSAGSLHSCWCDNAAADEVVGSAAEAHPLLHSPSVSPVRELTPERQSASERPPSLSPTPPAQNFSLAEPLVFGPEPRPAGNPLSLVPHLGLTTILSLRTLIISFPWKMTPFMVDSMRSHLLGPMMLLHQIDGREVVVTESLIRAQLQLDDANGIFDMPIDDILEGMGVIGYPTDVLLRTMLLADEAVVVQLRAPDLTLLHISYSKSSPDAGFKPLGDDEKKVTEGPGKEGGDPSKEGERDDQEKDVDVNSTNNVYTVSSSINTIGSSFVNADGSTFINAVDLPDDLNMPPLEDIFYSDDDEYVGAEADMNNLDAFIPVSPIPTTKVYKDLPIEQIIRDFNSAPQTRRMKKNLEEHEEVYVCQPPGFEDPDFPDRVYKFEKALYRLHQAPRACQDKYVGEIKKKFTEVKNASTPIETQKPLLKDEDGKEVDVHMYRSMIGSLMYLTSSRPDIMFVVCACARYQVNPKVSHLHAVKRIFRYLKGQPKLGLWYPKYSLFDLVAYTNSDSAGASLDRKSTTGGCQFLGCRLISWQCKK